MKTNLIILLTFGYFISSKCLDDDEVINSSLNLNFFNVTSLTFTDAGTVRLANGRTIKELNCVEFCKVRVDWVKCSRKIDSLAWRCISPSLQRSSYAFNHTFIDCDYFERDHESSDLPINVTSCYLSYSLKPKNSDEADYSLLVVILVCFVTVALFVEFLKRWFGCYTPIVINTRECSARIVKRKPDLPLRTAFSSIPPAVLTNVLKQDLNLDRKLTKSPVGDNYI